MLSKFIRKHIHNDFTMDWVEPKNLKLSIDLYDQLIFGVPITDIIDKLSFLGPSDEPKSVSSGSIRYKSSGFEINFNPTTKEIDGIVVYIKAEPVMNYEQFKGELFFQKKPIKPTVESIKTCLGEPTKIDIDDEEIVLSYISSKYGLDIECDLDKTIKIISLYVLDTDSSSNSYAKTKSSAGTGSEE